MEAQSLPVTGRRFVPRSPRILAAFSDERLVEQVRAGNEAAFEAIYDRHHRAMLSFCRHMLASPDEAEDAVQQTFISAYNKLREDVRDVNLKPWLYTIARNRCLSLLRARRERPAEIDDVPTVGLTDEVQQRTDLRELLSDLRELPEDQRAALVLSELGDLSHAEIGHIVGCEGAKVKSLVFQARSSLIESRNAREIPCHEIREQLATASGGELRRGPLRRHLRACDGCAQFRDDVRRQRRAIAAILPVIPSIGLKQSALAAVGIGGGGGAAGGGLASLLGSGLAVKGAAILAVAGIGLGGGLVIESKTDSRDAEAAGGQKDAVSVQVATTKVKGSGGIVLTRHKSGGTGHASPATAERRGPTGRAGSGHTPGTRRGHGHGRHGGRGTGRGPGGPGAPGGSAPQTTATGPSNPSAGHGHDGSRGNSGGTHTNNGRHLGWQIGRGNPHNETGAHNPPGHDGQSDPEPAPAPEPTTEPADGEDDGGGTKEHSQGHGHGHDPKLPKLPIPLPPVQ